MWGKYVESELEKVRASDKSKDHKGLERKIQAKLRAILHPLENKPGEDENPKPVPKGTFRDPMQFIGKQEKKK